MTPFYPCSRVLGKDQPMKKMNWKWTLVFAVALVVTAVLLDSLAWAKPPAPPPPPPPPPPIHYQINYFTAPGGGSFSNFEAMNNDGVTVGTYTTTTREGRGFIYDPNGILYDATINPDQARDLNDLVDLTGVVEVPSEWFIAGGRSVNDYGAILVTIKKVLAPNSTDPGFLMRGALVDASKAPGTNGKWAATPISVPDAVKNSVPVYFYGRHINNKGDLLGVFRGEYVDGTQTASAFIYNTGLYSGGVASPPEILPFTIANLLAAQLNNPRNNEPSQLAGLLGDSTRTIFRYTLGDAAPEEFRELSYPSTSNVVNAINGFGEFCGRIRVPKQKGGLYIFRPFCFDPDSQTSPTLIGTEADEGGDAAWDINDSGDVVLDSSDLFHDGKLLRMVDLVVGNSDDVAYFRGVRWGGNARLTEQDATGFPCIGTYSAYFGCLLVPVP